MRFFNLKTKKILVNLFKTKRVRIGLALAIVIVFFALLLPLLFSSISVNGKTYSCFMLQRNDRNNIQVLSNLVSSLTDARNQSMKENEKKINNCGTEKEQETTPALKELIPSDIQAMLNEYNKTKLYTIMDFQQCRNFWLEAKQEAENNFDSQIDKQNTELDHLLSKNNCRLVR
jgi:hypothetical protein